MQHKLDIHLLCINRLKDEGLTGVGVLEVYYHRRVAPLMACPLLMSQMGYGDYSEQAWCCCISQDFPPNDEVRAQLLEVVDAPALVVVPTPGPPLMLPSDAAVDLVSHPPCSSSFSVYFRKICVDPPHCV